MPLDFWTTIASIGTFIVIAATAVAAMVQLRHMRAANKVAAIQQFLSSFEGPEFRDAFHFVRTQLPERLKDPAFRRGLRSGSADRSEHPEVQICNFFDQWGLYYRDNVIDRQSFMRVNAAIVVGFWRSLEPVIALIADPEKGNMAFQQFEYLAIHAQRWLERHPDGDWPKGEKRIRLTDSWCDIDAQTSKPV